MQRAQRRGACVSERFWFRRDVGAPPPPGQQPRETAADDAAADQYEEMTVTEIVNGKVRTYYTV